MKMMKLPVGMLMAVTMLGTSVIPQGVQASVMTDYEMSTVSSQSKINEVFDRFHYTMSVEWDQKDEAFKAQAESDLLQAIQALKDSGVSVSEIQNQMEKQLLNGKGQAEYRRFVDALKAQNVSPDEAAALTTKFMEKNYAEGANFNGGGGRTSWRFVAAVLVIAVVTYVIIRHHDDDDHDHDENQNEEPGKPGKPGHGDCDYPTPTFKSGGYGGGGYGGGSYGGGSYGGGYGGGWGGGHGGWDHCRFPVAD